MRNPRKPTTDEELEGEEWRRVEKSGIESTIPSLKTCIVACWKGWRKLLMGRECPSGIKCFIETYFYFHIWLINHLGS